ncbi:hypothetical protein [Burkholderia gladioli]|uniref:hypothetical protein n=1 Tax=Burkholderia gladioli TaxID=28095 RepID=UPI00163E1848|nr:hypothetical protein [Burkholderia gladioli]
MNHTADVRGDEPGGRSAHMRRLMSAMPSNDELRDAGIAEVMADQIKVIDAMHEVIKLQNESDLRLTATVQAFRDVNAQYLELLGAMRAAFVGEVAAKAADQARRVALEAVADELVKLRLAVEQRREVRWSGQGLSWRLVALSCAASVSLAAVVVALVH